MSVSLLNSPRTAAPPILALAKGMDLAAELALPSQSSNLFQRLIRNPHPESAVAKERECAEMLCSLLQNAPAVRTRIFQWMSRCVQLDIPDIDDLHFVIDTEQPIGAKRDDLRIIGFRAADAQPAVTWTVEIKVGASFHDSSRQIGADIEDDEQLPVNQLLNYDDWLVDQSTEYRAGFVLAIHDRTIDLPKLKCRWACLTWTGLGEQLVWSLREDRIPPAEQFLARHALGFVRAYLWRATEMSSAKLEFNDVALIRAFAMLWSECDAKVNALVAPLLDVLAKEGIGEFKTGHTKKLFGGSCASMAYQDLGPNAALYAGIGALKESGADYLSVWTEIPPKHPAKGAIKAGIDKLADKLKERNSAWRLPSRDESNSEWIDVELSISLATILAADDQEAAVVDFVRSALSDLQQTGISALFAKYMSGG